MMPCCGQDDNDNHSWLGTNFLDTIKFNSKVFIFLDICVLFTQLIPILVGYMKSLA